MGPFTEQITFLTVSDLGRSVEFWGDLLGLTLVHDQGDCRIYESAPNGFVGLCQREGAAGGEHSLITLVTDDVDAWHQRLVDAGTHCDVEPRHTERYNLYNAFYRDPDGHRLEIQRFLDPDWKSGS